MLSLLLSVLLLQPTAAPAAPEPTAPIDCRAVRVSLGNGLEPWVEPVPAAPTIRPGMAMPVTPGQGVTLEIETAGIYGIAIDTGAWIDLTRDGQSLRSSAHEHGPSCSGIRKIVDFQLAPGRYAIMLSRTDAAAVRTLVFRK